jgi:hypothetical protein
MKIISSGHDYYDGAGMGVDETILFVRKDREILVAPFSVPRTIEFGASHDLKFGYILLGGEAFPFVKESFPHKTLTRGGRFLNYQEVPPQFHFDKETVLQAYEQGKKHATRRYFGYASSNVDDITQHFDQLPGKEATDWMIENRVITGHVYGRQTWDERARERKRHVHVNADISNLSEFDFFKLVDPATAHMRIANFIGGVLPHGTDTVEISDKSKIVKAGHDPVTSFRMAKGTKKPRRGKS